MIAKVKCLENSLENTMIRAGKGEKEIERLANINRQDGNLMLELVEEITQMKEK